MGRAGSRWEPGEVKICHKRNYAVKSANVPTSYGCRHVKLKDHSSTVNRKIQRSVILQSAILPRPYSHSHFV